MRTEVEEGMAAVSKGARGRKDFWVAGKVQYLDAGDGYNVGVPFVIIH